MNRNSVKINRAQLLTGIFAVLLLSLFGILATSASAQTVLGPPTNLTAVAVSSSQIHLSWTAPSSDGGSAITGYKIERSTNGGTFSTIVPDTGSTSTAYSDTGLAPSTPYTYRVSAITLLVTSSPSNTASATTKPLPPAAPTGVTATAKSSISITVSWTASAGATWYQVFNSTSSSGPFTKFGGTSGTSLVNVGLHPSTTYYYVVQASNSGGTSPQSSPPASATTLPAPPATPTGVTATAKSSSSILISWNPSDGAAWYGVFSSTSSSGPFAKIGASSSTSFTNTGLSQNTTYYYEVRGANTGGTSALSSPPVSATTKIAPPATPTGVTATAKSSTSITVSWTASASATWYQVFNSTSSSGPFTKFGGTSGTSLVIWGLHPSTTYYFEVRASNTGGTSALSSPPASATTTGGIATAPQPPTGLTATTVSSSQINLSWTAPSNNGGSAITGYEIERSADGGTTWSIIQSNTGSTTTTFSDSGLNPSTAFTYRVSAINSIGTSSPSNTASAITQSATDQLTVKTQSASGRGIAGLSIELKNSTGQLVASGFSPVTFTLKNSAQYTVGATSFSNYTFDHWFDTGSVINPRSISISSDTQITAVYRDSAFVISPSRGPAGTTVSVTGTTFSHNHSITLTWDGTAVTTNPASITSNSTGGFTASFNVSSTAPAGSHTVQATDGANTHSATFVVGPSSAITLYKTSGIAGDAVKITGTNFTPNAQISMYFDGNSLQGIRLGQGGGFVPNSNPATIETDPAGNFVADIQVLDRPAGNYNVKATDQSNSDTKSFTITPGALLLNPTSGHDGTIVNFRASGFGVNSTISITFDGTAVTTNPSSLKSDSVGEFQGSFTVPTTATIGSHPLQISDSVGNRYPSSFTVTDPSTPMFSVKTIVSGIKGSIAMAFIPDNGPGKDGSGNFLVNEQNGTVIVVKNNGGTFVKQSVPFVIVPHVQVYPDAGLLGITFDPNWVTTKMVYFYSTVNINGVIKNQVFRYHAINDTFGNIVADTSIGQQLILDKIPADFDHDGGHMKFDSQGNLYVSTGDNFGYTASQDLTSIAGKLLKITPLASPNSNGLLYSIPSTNPFVSNPNPYIRKEIYSYGVRNTFSFDIDSQTGKIYFNHVGQSAWESIVDTTNPTNLGWSNYEGPTIGNPQNVPNYSEPIYWYPHQGIEPVTGFAKDLEAITGGAFYHYTTNYYPSELQGAYFFGDYGIGNIVALLPTDKNPPQIDPVTGVPKAQVETVMSGLTLAPVDMQVWNGKLYYVTLTGSVSVLNYS